LTDRKKRVRSKSTIKYLQLREHLVKIDSVDPEIIGLKGIIKKEINATITYSPVGKHAERVK